MFTSRILQLKRVSKQLTQLAKDRGEITKGKHSGTNLTDGGNNNG